MDYIHVTDAPWGTRYLSITSMLKFEYPIRSDRSTQAGRQAGKHGTRGSRIQGNCMTLQVSIFRAKAIMDGWGSLELRHSHTRHNRYTGECGMRNGKW